MPKKCAYLSSKFEVLIVGEIEQQFFCQTLWANNFSLGEKTW